MRRMVDSEISQNTIKLQQMGAKVNVINSTLCYVNFDISGFILQYVYNINHKGNYFLERTRPYPLAMQELDSEKGIVDLIKIDVEKFKNALKCHHIDSFINIARRINYTFESFEDTFLNYNIPAEKVESMYEKIRVLESELEDIRNTAKKLEFNDIED